MLKFKFVYFILFSLVYSVMIQHSDILEVVENQEIKVEVLINEQYENIKDVVLYYKSSLLFEIKLVLSKFSIKKSLNTGIFFSNKVNPPAILCPPPYSKMLD